MALAMLASQGMRRVFLALTAPTLWVAIFAGTTAWAEKVVPLLNYTNVWRYHDSGTDPGFDWMTTAFDDAEWPAGPGPHGLETTVPYPYFLRVGTPLVLGSPATAAHYLRIHFQFDPAHVAPAQQLVADLLVDDGCVIFLNGAEIGRLRVPAGQTHLTYAGALSDYEGANEVLVMSATGLVAGDNVLAVEVHQVASGSSDIFFGMRLRAVAPDPLVITRHPESITSFPLSSATFSVATSGGPAFYQWLKDGAVLAGATNSIFTVVSAAPTAAGVYSVIVSNALGAVESQGAALTVQPFTADFAGPHILGAQQSLTSTRQVRVIFNERLLGSTAARRENYVLTQLVGTGVVSFTFVTYNPGPPSQATITSDAPLWGQGSNYLLTLNNIRDISPNQNIIAPDTQVAVSYLANVPLVRSNHVWHYHASLLDDPSVVEAPWFATNYVENSFWRAGVGSFYTNFQPTCDAPLTTTIPYQLHRTLFRTTFNWPGPAGSGTLNLTYQYNAGVVFYLNGTEILRDNLPPTPEPLDIYSWALSNGGNCRTNLVTVTNLLPGTNWLAAAVYQPRQPQNGIVSSDILFNLVVDDQSLITPDIPGSPAPPRLDLTRLADDKFRLSWTGPGYALESATNFIAGLGGKPGPWMEVPNMSNPYTNSPSTQPGRLFRLRK